MAKPKKGNQPVPANPPQKPKLADDVVRLLRRKLLAAKTENAAMDKALRGHELHRAALEARATGAEQKFSALFDAIRELSKHVPNGPVEARKAREAARKLLESVGLTPPRSLGSSRVRRKKRKPKKKP